MGVIYGTLPIRAGQFRVLGDLTVEGEEFIDTTETITGDQQIVGDLLVDSGSVFGFGTSKFAADSATGNVALQGTIRLKEQPSDPAQVADHGFLYTKDIAAVTELFWRDSAGNVVQITSGGAIPSGGGWQDDGTVVRLVTTTDTVAIGATAMFGAEKFRVVGDSRIEGKLTVTGALDPTEVDLTGVVVGYKVSGTVVIDPSRNLTNIGTISAGASTLASLSVTGAATVGTTLGVTGATTLSSTLSAGASTLASATITAAATVGTTLGVTGAATLSSTLSAGATTLASGSVTGALTVGTTLGVTGATTLSSTLSAGASTLASATITAAATVGTTLGVTGLATFSGGASLTGTLAGTYTLGGTPTLGATLALNGQTLSGTGTFSGSISFTGAGTAVAVTNSASFGVSVISPLVTRDSGTLTLQTTTGGDIVLDPATNLILPTTNNSTDLGDATNRFRLARFGTSIIIGLGGATAIHTDLGITFGAGASITDDGGDLVLSNVVRPSGNGTQNLGTGANKWNDVRAVTFTAGATTTYADGSVTTSAGPLALSPVTDLSLNPTGAVLYNQRLRQCEIYMDCLAGAAAGSGGQQVHIRAAELIAGNVLAAAFTGQQLDILRNAYILLPGGHAAGGNVVVNGTLADGTAGSDTIVIPAASGANTAVVGVKGFAVVTSIDFPATGVGETIEVRMGRRLALPHGVSASGDVFKVKANNADLPAASFTVDTTNETVDVGDISAGDDFTVWYRVS